MSIEGIAAAPFAGAAPITPRHPLRHAVATMTTAAVHAVACAVTWPLARMRGRAAGYRHLGRGLARLSEALGPTYVKLAQVLSVRPDLLPPEIIAELRRLQEQVTPLPFDVIDAVCRRCYGDCYATRLAIERTPIAAGAIAQVHRATDASGRVLALKIRRPDVTFRVCSDLALIKSITGGLARWHTLRNVPVRELAAEISNVVVKQLDFRREAQNNRRFRRNFAFVEDVHFPPLEESLCNDDIIAMEFMADRQRVDAAECGEAVRRRSALCGLRALYKMLFDDGFVHADLHAGNFFASPHGGAIMLDTGLVAEIPEGIRRDFVDFFFAVANDNGPACAELIWRTALARPTLRMPVEFATAMTSFVTRHAHLKSGEFEVTRFVYELLEIQRRHGLRSSPAFVTMVLAIVVYDGVCKTLYPGLDFQAEARGYLIAARYGRAGHRGGHLF